MMNDMSPHITSIILTVTIVFFALIILWETAVAMLKKRKISGFLPFFLLGIILSFYSSFILFETFLNQVWLILESLILFNLIWILVSIRRKNANN